MENQENTAITGAAEFTSAVTGKFLQIHFRGNWRSVLHVSCFVGLDIMFPLISQDMDEGNGIQRTYLLQDAKFQLSQQNSLGIYCF